MKSIHIFLLLLLISCKGNQSENRTEELSLSVPTASIESAEFDYAPAEAEPKAKKVEQTQKIIKESYLVFETSDMEKTYQKVRKYIKSNNGYIQSDRSTISIRGITGVSFWRYIYFIHV